MHLTACKGDFLLFGWVRPFHGRLRKDMGTLFRSVATLEHCPTRGQQRQRQYHERKPLVHRTVAQPRF
jgi:hypothetical protein